MPLDLILTSLQRSGMYVERISGRSSATLVTRLDIVLFFFLRRWLSEKLLKRPFK